MEEVQVKPEKSVFPQTSAEHQAKSCKDKGICQRMAKLLWNSKYEESDKRNQWMAVPQNPNVHLETMEEAKDKGKKPNEDGGTCRPGVPSREYKTGLLVYIEYGCRENGNDKRKTDTQWLL